MYKEFDFTDAARVRLYWKQIEDQKISVDVLNSSDWKKSGPKG